MTDMHDPKDADNAAETAGCAEIGKELSASRRETGTRTEPPKASEPAPLESVFWNSQLERKLHECKLRSDRRGINESIWSCESRIQLDLLAPGEGKNCWERPAATEAEKLVEAGMPRLKIKPRDETKSDWRSPLDDLGPGLAWNG
jgi:hypothetical protein